MRLVLLLALLGGCSSAPTVTPAMRDGWQLEADVRVLERRLERVADNLET